MDNYNGCSNYRNEMDGIGVVLMALFIPAMIE